MCLVYIQNIPQLIIQGWYVLNNEGFENSIAIFSALFSAISIIVSILGMFMQQSLMKTEEFISVKMNISGKQIVSRLARYKGRVARIQQSIAALIEVDANLIEIHKLESIEDGLSMRMDIHVEIERKYSELLAAAQLNGKLAKIFMDCWRLKGALIVSDVKCGYFRPQKKIKVRREGQRASREMHEQVGDTPF